MVSTTGKSRQEAVMVRPRRLRDWAEEVQRPDSPEDVGRVALGTLLLFPGIAVWLFILTIGWLFVAFSDSAIELWFNVVCMVLATVGLISGIAPNGRWWFGRNARRICATTCAVTVIGGWIVWAYLVPLAPPWLEGAPYQPMTLYLPSVVVCASALAATLVFPPNRRNGRAASPR